MHSAHGNQWMMILLATVILSTVYYQKVSASHDRVRVTRSAVESLRDRGTYIVCFTDNVTEEEQHRFANTLIRMSASVKNFTAEIIKELFIIKCLTTRLSERALSWVRTICTCK